jgi:hypothetical protein
MKKKTPSFDELFSRFLVQIKNREPEKELTTEIINRLRAVWSIEPIHNFYSVVIKMEQNSLKVQDILKKSELIINEFQLGYSISGDPIITTHVVQRQMKVKDPKRYSKKGSKSEDYVSVIEYLPNYIF